MYSKTTTTSDSEVNSLEFLETHNELLPRYSPYLYHVQMFDHTTYVTYCVVLIKDLVLRDMWWSQNGIYCCVSV